MNDQIRINWYRSKVDRQVMSALMQSSDLRAFGQVLAQLGLYAVTGTLAYLAYRNLHAANWPGALPLLLLALFAHGTNGSFFGGIACHELSHKTPFGHQVWNTFFLKVYAFLSWFDPLGYRLSHVRHHQVTVHADHDGEVVLPVGLDWYGVRFILKSLTFDPLALLRLLRFWVYAAFGRIGPDNFFKGTWLARVLPESNAELRREHRNWARVILLGHLALAAVFIATGHWILIVIFTFGCQYCSWLTVLCGGPQHAGLSPNVADFRLCCRTYTCSWLPAFFYWNMQYHVEHHMFPAVPFYHLPRLRQAIAHDLPPAPHGLWATWRELIPVLRRQRRDPNYVSVPPLPARPAGPADQVDVQTLGLEASRAV
ncbi:MAG: fatty acid desaturase [Opitutaceae bacterium]|nr:fatty acid desaturase [Opitutaceae bacterium]